jgi:aspartate-semialdehyde dehydrogenase
MSSLINKKEKAMKKVAFVGWRGMVGSVLMDRMKTENDFHGFEPFFYSTSQIGSTGPEIGMETSPVADAHDLEALRRMDIIASCQGGEYTTAVYGRLRRDGFTGYWIDAASTLRMSDDAVIILDPVNRPVIDKAIRNGVKNYIGGNCTVSLMLMALQGLFQADWVEWLSTMTYQAASGAGAKTMIELVQQIAGLSDACQSLLRNPATTALQLDGAITEKLRNQTLPMENFGAPLAASLFAWIDKPMDNGQTREEWKGVAETNKILGNSTPVPVDGICVRVGAMRCHSQAVTVKLRQDYPLNDIIDHIAAANPWVEIVPNNKTATLERLTPAAVSGTLAVPIGRIRKMVMGPTFLTAFTVGDQLLWGAAEPLRRMLRILLEPE